MKRPVSILAAVLAGALMGNPALAQKTVLTVGMQSSDIAGVLDPHLNSGTPGKAMLQWMFNGLVRIKPGELSRIHGARSRGKLDLLSRRQGWTFKLRQGVQCHHGYGEFTAEDAVYSLKRASSKKG